MSDRAVLQSSLNGEQSPEVTLAESIIDTMRDPILLLNGSLHVVLASREFYRTFGVTREETEGRLVYELGNRQWDTRVVCATHSPSMITPMSPHSVRVLRREVAGGKATSVIDNKPYSANFFAVRSSLGVTPADSLPYAPVTVVAEGDTEVAARDADDLTDSPCAYAPAGDWLANWFGVRYPSDECFRSNR
jgi:hypothetical protein